MKARGWRVFATARKAQDIARLRDEIGVESLYLDYAEPQSIAQAAEQALKATDGKLTALFNNGTYGQPGAVEDLKPDVLRAQFEAAVFGWHDLTARMIPAMRANGGGRLVFCSSVLGLIAAPYRGAYCASKFAVEALADVLRLELRGTGIHVVLIEPGPIASRFAEHALEAYRRNIDLEDSPHREIYRARIARWSKVAHRPSSSDLRRLPPSSPTPLRVGGPNPAITSRSPPTPRFCSGDCYRPGPSTPLWQATKVARQAFSAMP
jgi:NAD(P)-dependent dehydrogenase (short-subunit alcohol dehydrogenase family)